MSVPAGPRLLLDATNAQDTGAPRPLTAGVRGDLVVGPEGRG
ncbi:hypothetical protein [Kineococcus arenarius]